MKKRINKFMVMLIIILAYQCIITSSFAQAPLKMSYQAVIRDANNQLVTNQSVGMRVSILQGSATGTEVYKEIYNPNPQTNANGLLTIEIGGGIALTGRFDTINWAKGPYFIKTETDPTGGTNYNVNGTSQMLSIPFAFYANKAENYNEIDPQYNASVAKGITSNDTTNWNNATRIKHYIGELFGGGIVFYVDNTGNHGFIVSLEDIFSTTSSWGLYGTNVANCESTWDGQTNSMNIIKTGVANTAAYMCKMYTGGGFNDWYLPAIDQLNLLDNSKYIINKILDKDGNISSYGPYMIYWSSTEVNSDYAFYYNFQNGYADNSIKNNNLLFVRAIRNF